MIQLVTGSSPVNNPIFLILKMPTLISRIIDKNDQYADFRTLAHFKNNNTDLVHYSLTNRGNALYFQKIIINKIFRMAVTPYWDSSRDGFSMDNTRFLNFGDSFQQKYSLITTVHRTKRNFSDLMYGNDSDSYGSFKSFFYRSSNFGRSFIVKQGQEARTTQAKKEREVELISSLSFGSAYAFDGKVPNAFKSFPMKSKVLSKTFENSFWMGRSSFAERFKEKLLTNITNITFFIRTVWFRTTMWLGNFKHPLSFHENEGYYRKKLAKSNMYHRRFAAEEKVLYFSAIGLNSQTPLDVNKDLKEKPKGGAYKRYIKKYPRWRLGIVHWGKKIMKFKKNFQFWNYARSLCHYYYRGFFMHSIFNCRADVFVLRMFGVRTLKFARILVQYGHVFKGSFPIKTPYDRIRRYDIVTISKKANLFITKKKYFKYWRNNKNSVTKRIQSRLIKTSPLMYCRQQKALTFYGEVKKVKYTMFFGDDLGVFNTPSRKTKYFNLNYNQVQKIISCSWW